MVGWFPTEQCNFSGTNHFNANKNRKKKNEFHSVHSFQISNWSVYIREILCNFIFGNDWRIFDFDLCFSHRIVLRVNVHLYDCIRK